jgi:hypothetical protein
MNQGITKSEQMTVFTPEYNRSSKVQAFAETKARKFVIRKPVLARTKLAPGFFQVMRRNGIPAMTAAITDKTIAHRAPLVVQSTTHRKTRIVTTVSSQDHPYLPFINRTIMVAVAPTPYIIGMNALAFSFNIVKAVIHARQDQRTKVDRDNPSPVPIAVTLTW